MYYQNAHSIVSRRESFCHELDRSDYDVVVITETWLRQIDDIQSQKYYFHRRDRSPESKLKRGGGVLIGVRKRLHCSAIELEKCSEFEQLAVRIDLPESELIVCAVYLRPDVDLESYSKHSEAVQQLVVDKRSSSKPCEVVVVGDYNLPHLMWVGNEAIVPKNRKRISRRGRQKGDVILKMKKDLGLYQKNDIENGQGRLLDLAFVMNKNQVTVVKPASILRKPDIYHEPIVLEFELN